MTDAAALLGQVAEALNGCERVGLGVRTCAVVTEHGVVLPIDGRWTVRLLIVPPFEIVTCGDDD